MPFPTGSIKSWSGSGCTEKNNNNKFLMMHCQIAPLFNSIICRARRLETKDKWTITLHSPSFSFLSSPHHSSHLVSSFSLACSATVTNAFAREIKMAAWKKNKNNHVQISFTGEAGKKLIHSKSTISNSYKNIFSPNTIQMVVSSQFHLLSSLIILFVV